jgi:hypothetical protein
VDFVGDADADVETKNIGTATEDYMLAVIDDLANAGMEIRTSPPTQVASPLHKLHAQAGFGKSASSAHAGNAAADDGDGARFGLYCGRQVICLSA